jgi:hypothetical protein
MSLRPAVLAKFVLLLIRLVQALLFWISVASYVDDPVGYAGYWTVRQMAFKDQN